eukprot:gene13877-19803_t
MAREGAAGRNVGPRGLVSAPSVASARLSRPGLTSVGFDPVSEKLTDLRVCIIECCTGIFRGLAATAYSTDLIASLASSSSHPSGRATPSLGNSYL